MNFGARSMTILAVLLTMFTLVSSLWAECAWVLWWEVNASSMSYRTADANIPGKGVGRNESQSWNILGSYTTNTACEKQQEWKINDMLASWRKEKAEAKFGEHTIQHDSGSNIISRHSEFGGETASHYWERIRYLCLPDTVDPRGPKGK